MQALQRAAAALADVLERENAALARLDLPAATALLHDKRAALEAFQAAAAQSDAAARAAMAADAGKPIQALATRLQEATVANKRLLERAMAAQQYIMSLLAQAARQSAPNRSYGAFGALVGRSNGAFALSARA